MYVLDYMTSIDRTCKIQSKSLNNENIAKGKEI